MKNKHVYIGKTLFPPPQIVKNIAHTRQDCLVYGINWIKSCLQTRLESSHWSLASVGYIPQLHQKKGLQPAQIEICKCIHRCIMLAIGILCTNCLPWQKMWKFFLKKRKKTLTFFFLLLLLFLDIKIEVDTVCSEFEIFYTYDIMIFHIVQKYI